jgi:hypothetical protein
MLNTEAVFKRLDLGRCAGDSVQRIREVITEAVDPLAKAKAIIKDILGLETTYTDELKARIVAQKVGEQSFKANHNIDDAEALLKVCEEYTDKFITNPANAWMFVKDETPTVVSHVVQVVKGIDVKVAVKANGKIKKGGKQILAAELYKKYVLEATTAATNQGFIAILEKELGMTKAGATTYAYNCKKQLGEPKGGIVKAKKGRKAK